MWRVPWNSIKFKILLLNHKGMEYALLCECVKIIIAAIFCLISQRRSLIQWQREKFIIKETISLLRLFQFMSVSMSDYFLVSDFIWTMSQFGRCIHRELSGNGASIWKNGGVSKQISCFYQVLCSIAGLKQLPRSGFRRYFLNIDMLSGKVEKMTGIIK